MGNIHSDFKMLRLIVVKVDEFISTKVIKYADGRTAKIMIKKAKQCKSARAHGAEMQTELTLQEGLSGAPGHFGTLLLQAVKVSAPAWRKQLLPEEIKLRTKAPCFRTAPKPQKTL